MDPTRSCIRAAPAQEHLTLAEVVRAGLASPSPPPLSPHHWKVLNALLACRTPQLGGHRYRCDHCGRLHFVPRSCGNRHCPSCQGHQALQWLQRQNAALLPIPYFHVVVTLPHALNPLIQQNQAPLYRLLFTSTSQTLLEFGRNNLGALLGLTLVLHTWSQTLLDHYHLHCIVTGGGPAIDGQSWKHVKEGFLFPVAALSKVLRGKFCAGLQHLYAQGQLQFHGQLAPLAQLSRFQALIREATAKSWNVYVKRPFAGPRQVLAYLSRYTHRVAITHRRLLSLDRTTNTVRFAYKLRRDPAPPQWTEMELTTTEFVRRFCLHILPQRFVKIRHYGLLSNRGREERLAQARLLLGVCTPTESQPLAATQAAPQKQALEGESPRLICPHCGERALVWLEFVPPTRTRGPPLPP